MSNKQLILDTLIALSERGYDISTLIGPALAARIEEIAELEKLDYFEAQMQQLMEDIQIDEKELNKAFEKLKLEEELQALKKKMGK